MQNDLTNNSNETSNRSASTYSLIVAEQKERGVFETLICALFILCAAFSISQLALQPVTLPTHLGEKKVAVHDASCTVFC